MGIIAGLKKRIKRISPDWVIVGIIVLSSCAAFGLGFLAGRDAEQNQELQVVQLPLTNSAAPSVLENFQEASVPAPSMPAGGQYVASKTGKSYHLPWCSGAKLIKEENKIWFNSKEEAEARGYAPAGNCPGI